MPTPRVSVLTATAREDGWQMVSRCLNRQTMTSFEWVLCCPESLANRMRFTDHRVRVIPDPPKREGDFYALNKCWNALAREARAECLVFAVDNIWFPKDALARFLEVHEADPLACVSAVGDHYRICPPWSDKPEVQWLTDTRFGMQGPNGEMAPGLNELSLAMMPRSKVLEVGGFDEEYDRARGWSEKEIGLRLHRAGCSFWLGTAVAHRIWTHTPDSTEPLREAANARAREMFLTHAEEITAGTRRLPPMEAA